MFEGSLTQINIGNFADTTNRVYVNSKSSILSEHLDHYADVNWSETIMCVLCKQPTASPSNSI